MVLSTDIPRCSGVHSQLRRAQQGNHQLVGHIPIVDSLMPKSALNHTFIVKLSYSLYAVFLFT